MSDWPFLFDFARSHAGERLALATLVAREGSSYRQPGARMLIAEDLSFRGTLSGGCLEEGIAESARAVLENGKPRRLVIDTRPHFGCPGKLHIIVEEIPTGLMDQVRHKLQARQSVLLGTNGTGTRIITPGTADPDVAAGFDLLEKACPPPRLVGVGWTPDMDPVLALARSLGWDCHRVLRDDRMLSDLPPVAGETIQVLSADEITGRFRPDGTTAVLVMTHHLATDLAFLRHTLPAGYGYIGLLGSRRRRETLLAELGELGLLEDPAATERLHAPAGLDLGGNHPSTIALAIVAEIQAVLAGADAGFLRDSTANIHPKTFAAG